MGNVIVASSLLCFVIAIAIAITFLGPILFALSPPVKHLRDAIAVLGPIRLTRAVPNDSIKAMSRRLLTDLIAPDGHASLLAPFVDRPLGDIVVIVHYRYRNLQRLINRLRFYAAITALALGAGFLNLLYHIDFVLSLPTISKAAEDNPLNLVPTTLFALLFFAIRLSVELFAIKDLLED